VGAVIGQHRGIAHYTLGQRRGLGIARGEPLYVTRICPGANSLTVGPRDAASRRTVEAGDLHILAPERPALGARLFGKIRSYGEPAACTVAAASDTALVVDFDEPQFAPSPGQRLVLYDHEDTVVAGGTIRGAVANPHTEERATSCER
jgi:tRNA-specific 2-thiouridylase